ncbi:MAG: M6 family metalloprotease domain-containing protein [Muribaculaceae bacterium]|nr:M6 family metalloprotease domain-containing protein [Muribaculaceae bacterium]
MLKKLFFLLVCCSLGIQAFGVPAYPEPFTFTQPDGTTIMLNAVGDEFQNGLTTSDGLTVMIGADGYIYYRTTAGISQVTAHDAADRNAAETAFIDTNREQLNFAAQITPQARERRASAMRGPNRVGNTEVPTIGSPRVPILLVEYQDKSMSNSKEKISDHYKTDAKSVYQYFVDQSSGQYTPQFDVYGIYTLDSVREEYGGNVYDEYGNRNDKGLGRMVEQAILKAGDEIDWSKYDNDGDGEADVCIVVYAGVGEAQASSTVPESIWPCQWYLSSAAYYGYGDIGAMERNGVIINRFGVFNEVNGSNDYGTTLDGIGTFCHEFSHCLGLPDFYDTNYGGHYGMGHWSLMCSGCYNGVQISGDTPVGYSAYEKNFMGWLDFTEAVPNTHYTLPAPNSGNDVAVRIKALNNNEYFILENRRKQGWDQCIANGGVLITHFTYIPERWYYNTPNNEDIQLATIIPADNSLNSYSESGDPYGNSNYEFTATSTPAMMANMDSKGNLASTTGGHGTIDKPVTEITTKSDGTASFWYMKTPFDIYTPVMQPTDTTLVDLTSFTAQWTDETKEQYVKSYTLWVCMDGLSTDPIMLDEADFSNLETLASGGYLTNVSSYYDQYLPEGWSCGSSLYVYNGSILIGDQISTKLYDMPMGYDKISVVINACSFYESAYGTAFVDITTSGSNASNGINLVGDTPTEHICVMDAAEQESISFYGSSYPMINNIKIYAGDITEQTKAPLLLAIEVGDSTKRTITGITEKLYEVSNLAAGGTFNYKVKSIYIDDSESPWSNIEQVTLSAKGKPGDANGDGNVDVNDVTTVINYILGKNPSPFNYDNANVNGDTKVDVMDVTLIINIILGLTD